MSLEEGTLGATGTGEIATAALAHLYNLILIIYRNSVEVFQNCIHILSRDLDRSIRVKRNRKEQESDGDHDVDSTPVPMNDSITTT